MYFRQAINGFVYFSLYFSLSLFLPNFLYVSLFSFLISLCSFAQSRPFVFFVCLFIHFHTRSWPLSFISWSPTVRSFVPDLVLFFGTTTSFLFDSLVLFWVKVHLCNSFLHFELNMSAVFLLPIFVNLVFHFVSSFISSFRSFHFFLDCPHVFAFLSYFFRPERTGLTFAEFG